jgi:hypothetical protein
MEIVAGAYAEALFGNANRLHYQDQAEGAKELLWPVPAARERQTPNNIYYVTLTYEFLIPYKSADSPVVF